MRQQSPGNSWWVWWTNNNNESVRPHKNASMAKNISNKTWVSPSAFPRHWGVLTKNIPAGSASSHTGHIPLAAPNQLEWHSKGALSNTHGPLSQPHTKADRKQWEETEKYNHECKANYRGECETSTLSRRWFSSRENFRWNKCLLQDRVRRLYLSHTGTVCQWRCLTFDSNNVNIFPSQTVRRYGLAPPKEIINK